MDRKVTSLAGFHADPIVEASETALNSFDVNSLAAAIHFTSGRFSRSSFASTTPSFSPLH